MSHVFTLSHVYFRPNRGRQHIVHCLSKLGEAGEAVGLDGELGSRPNIFRCGMQEEAVYYV
jgi:hypothetical protein